MIENFEELKSQLKDLSEIVNSFKSEAVQLRIVELVFVADTATEVDQGTEKKPSIGRKRSRAKTKVRADATNVSTPKRTAPKSAGNGAVATLTRLLEDGFFKTPKSIHDIVTHCELNLAHKFKQNEFSGKLGRLVRDGKLKREKNSDKQYEYQSK